MEREGRAVLTFTVLPYPQNPRPAARTLNKLGSARVAGIFDKFAGARSSGNRTTDNPAGKSRGKCNSKKGTQRSRASEAALNYKRANWRVTWPGHVSGSGKLGSGSGHSASGMLDELAAQDRFDCDQDYDDHDDDYASDGYE